MVIIISLAVYLSVRLGRRDYRPSPPSGTDRPDCWRAMKDYSVRATVGSPGDEVGRLTESFNEMLGRIQSQDAALSLSQAKMEALIHSIDGIVWERTPDTSRFTFVSRQSEEIFGLSAASMAGHPELLGGEFDPQDADESDQDSARDGGPWPEPFTYEYRMVAADNRTVWIRESGTVLVEKGHRSPCAASFRTLPG